MKHFLLSFDEREVIEDMLRNNLSISLIAIKLGRSLKTIKAELSRGGYPNEPYRAHKAQEYMNNNYHKKTKWLYCHKSIRNNFHFQ